MVVLAGLDLAWTRKNESGVCIFESEGEALRLVALEAFSAEPREFAAMLDSYGEDVIAAIDAPLIVEPERTAERELGRAFGRFHASAHSSNPELLRRTDRMAGPKLAQLLGEAGYCFDPWSMQARATGRYALEVYPHAAHVVMFGLCERIKYKKGLVAAKRAGQAEYCGLLGNYLAAIHPDLLADGRIALLLAEPPNPCSGRMLKHIEDQLDALTCALVAYRAWRQGADGLRLFGSPRHGHIAVPQWPEPRADVRHVGNCRHG